jgi:hypothetical protein
LLQKTCPFSQIQVFYAVMLLLEIGKDYIWPFVCQKYTSNT